MPTRSVTTSPDAVVFHRRANLSRRRFVAWLGSLAATLVVLPRRSGRAVDGEPSAARRGDDEAALLADLDAVAATLVPADVTPGMAPEDVARWLEVRRAADPHALERLGRSMTAVAPVLAAVAGHAARFAELTAEQRERAIAQLLGDRNRTLEPSAWEHDVARPMMVWFYGSGRGYSVVGFGQHTGTSVPGDLDGYVRPPSFATPTAGGRAP